MVGITDGTMGSITATVGTMDSTLTVAVAVDSITTAVVDSITLIAHLLTEMVPAILLDKIPTMVQ